MLSSGKITGPIGVITSWTWPAGDQEIELFIRPEAPQRPSYPEALGLRHLAFRVADVAATVQALTAKGIETEPIRVDPFTHGKMTFFFDPDGLPLEIHE